MKHPLTILISGAGTATALSVIKGLRKQTEIPVRILTYDMDAFVSGAFVCDGFYKVPSAESPKFIASILTIVKKEHVDAIIPIVDYEFLSFIKYRDKFAKHNCLVVLSSAETLAICTDKFKTMDFFDSIGIPRPKSFSLSDAQKKSVKFPLFIKPAIMGRASLDANKLDTKEDLAYFSRKVSHPIIQEYIAGKEVTVDVLCSLEKQYIFSVSRERLETKNGLSVKGRIFHDPKLTKQVKLIVEKLGIVGHCNVQCFSTPKGYIFTEVNPRYSGGGALSLGAGFNSPHLLLRLIAGLPVDPKKIKITPVSIIRYWEEIMIVGKKATMPHYLSSYEK